VFLEHVVERFFDCFAVLVAEQARAQRNDLRFVKLIVVVGVGVVSFGIPSLLFLRQRGAITGLHLLLLLLLLLLLVPNLAPLGKKGTRIVWCMWLLQ